MPATDVTDFLETAAESFGHAIDLNLARTVIRDNVFDRATALSIFDDFSGPLLDPFLAFVNLAERRDAIANAYDISVEAGNAELFAQSVELLVFAGFLAAEQLTVTLAIGTVGPLGAIALASFVVADIVYVAAVRDDVLAFYRNLFTDLASPGAAETLSFQSPVLAGLASTQLSSVLVLDPELNNFADGTLISGRPAVIGGNGADVLDASSLGTAVRLEGGGGADQIRGGSNWDQLSGGAGADFIYGGGGSDSIWGGSGADHIEGNTGVDYIEGGAGDDTLVGGISADFYSVGISQGADIIADQGGPGGGQDTIRFYLGSVFSEVNLNWFSRDGADMLIRAFDGTNLVLDLRIQNMDSTANQIELLELYAGDATAPFWSQGLVSIWTQLITPSTGFRDPLGTGQMLTEDWTDGDGFSARRRFLGDADTPGDPIGLRHLGVDWNADSNADELVFATCGGTISYVSADAGGDRGGVVMINHTLPDGRQFTTVYMHLENIPSEILDGGTVNRGDLLGDSQAVGGNPEHLHYEVRVGHQSGEAGVGYGYYDADPNSGIVQGILVGTGIQDGIAYADVSNPWDGGAGVRYLDPIAFTNGLRTAASDDEFFLGPGFVGQNSWHAGDGFDTLTVNVAMTSEAVKLDHVVPDFINPDRTIGFVGFGPEVSYAQYANMLNVTGVEVYRITTGSGIDHLEGGEWGDTFTTNAGADELFGWGGNDILNGGADADRLRGDFGDDTLNGGSGADRLEGGEGSDTASYVGSVGPVDVNIGAGVGVGGDAAGDTYDNIENLIGSALNDVLTGSVFNNKLNGLGGADVVNGGDGNDELAGQSGTDTLSGGRGDDTLRGGSAGDALDGGGGADTATYSASTVRVIVDLALGTGAGGEAAGDTLVNIEHLLGSAFNDILTGSSAANNFNGGDGDDTLSGGADADTLLGAAGNDVLEGGAGGDVLTGGAGADTARYAGSSAAVRVNLATGAVVGRRCGGRRAGADRKRDRLGLQRCADRFGRRQHAHRRRRRRHAQWRQWRRYADRRRSARIRSCSTPRSARPISIRSPISPRRRTPSTWRTPSSPASPPARSPPARSASAQAPATPTTASSTTCNRRACTSTPTATARARKSSSPRSAAGLALTAADFVVI